MKHRAASRSQHGQMTIEFVFAMMFLLVFVAAMMQALMFELDVFNKIGLTRLAAFKTAHASQDETEKAYFTESAQFKSIGDMGVEMKLGAWELTDDLQYGDKTYYMRKGAKHYEPFIYFRQGEWAFVPTLLLGHYESTKSYWLHLPEFNPGMQALYLLDTSDLDDLGYMF